MDTPRKLSNPQQYTIGLITALSIELAAVRAMLDRAHDEPHQFRRNDADNNQYIWGEIKSHNVVIASMPNGNYGLVSAAQTASWLLSSLPHIRFGLMIGIGAGVPREGFDIRLGDIVVSQPTGTSPGVVQYDLGKVQKDGYFQRVGSLNRPPNFLLTGLGNLSASQILQGPETPQILAQALERHPNLKEEDADGHSYVHPGALNDRLFEASATHVPQPRGQVACALCDTTKEVVRNPRPSSNPIVHYGTIASGNYVVKDGISRDIILQNLDANCICFEMEAAGLMNTFSCLVIRGICDYADSHKNDRWQKYAAIAAAAFAKELLQTIDPVIVRGALEMDEVINQRHRDWLHPIDASKAYNDALAHRQALTGQWFLESQAYSDWKDSGSSTLWLHGKSGSGKTILASTVIENLKKRQFSSGIVLYFYFSFADSRQQSLDGAIRALAYQLSCQNSVARDELRLLYDDDHSKGFSQPKTDSICNTFNKMVENTGDIWIVLDALDECETRRDGTSHAGLLSWLKHLVPSHSGLHLFVTSRPEHDIMNSLQKYANHQILLSNHLITDDIRTYVHAEVSRMERWECRQDVQKMIKKHLMEKADGVFRWVSCQLKVLEDCPDLRVLKAKLASLPRTLEETYAAALLNIPENFEEQTKLLLQFLVFSERPLQLAEAVDILATTPNDELRFDPGNRMPKPAEISRFCSSLLVIEGQSQLESAVVQLAHSSVKEYLSSRHLQPQTFHFLEERRARASVAKICLAYLLELKGLTAFRKIVLSRSKETSCKMVKTLDTNILYSFETERPLAEYAARSWIGQAKKVEVNEAGDNNSDTDTIRQLIVELLRCESTYELCYGLQHMRRPSSRYKREDIVVPPVLRYVVIEGLTWAVKHLLEKDTRNINQSLVLFSPIALFSPGNSATAETVDRDWTFLLYLKQNTDFGSSALEHISSTGDSELLGLMLATVAHGNMHIYEKALRTASAYGYTKIVQMLLDAAVAVKQARIGRYEPKHGNNAGPEGCENLLANMLLQQVVKSEFESLCCWPLFSASRNGFIEIVRLLLDNGANIDKTSPITVAAENGHAEVVTFLLERGANVNIGALSPTNNLLYVAFRRGHAHSKIVQTIFAKVDNDTFYKNSLIVACAEGETELVTLLMQRVKDASSYYESLIEASDAGHHQIVQMLIEKGTAVDAGLRSHQTPLSAATASNRTDVAKLLLMHDADPGGRRFGDSALQIASGQGNEELVQELLRKGANPDTPGITGDNALSCAAHRGHENIVRMLLDAGADINEGVGPYGCAFDAAYRNHHENIVRMIGEKGVSTRSTVYRFWVRKLSTDGTNRSQRA